MKQSKKPSSDNRSTPQVSSMTVRVSGLSLFTDNLKSLAKLNPDWKLTPEEIIAAGKDGQKIYQCKFSNKPLELVPDPDFKDDPNAVAVLIAGNQVGYIDSSVSAHVGKLLETGCIKSMTCGIFGGKYKIVDQAGGTSTHSSTVSVSVKITYAEEIPAVSKKSRNSRKKTSNAKKPFYKRWWFWIIAILLMVNSCGKNEDSTIVATEPPETVAIIETTTPAVTEPETIATTAAPTTVPTTIPETETVTVPETEPPVEATEPVPVGITYVLNTNSEIFHYPSCSSAKKMSDSNKRIFTGTRDEVINMGYKSCGRCHP